jgi:hypothetical protein
MTPTSDLMRIFDFTVDDLEANRAGRMSEQQLERLESKRAHAQWIGGIGCLASVIFVIPFFASGLSYSMKNGATSFFIILFIVALPVIYLYLGVMDREADIRSNRVTLYSGYLRLSEQHGKYGPTYWISLIDIPISASIYNQLRDYLGAHGEKNKVPALLSTQ